MEEPKYLVGQFLLAMPGMSDPRFDKAVIAMCVHDDGGALGIGLGRLMPRIGFHSLLKQLGIAPGVAPDAAGLRNGNSPGGDQAHGVPLGSSCGVGMPREGMHRMSLRAAPKFRFGLRPARMRNESESRRKRAAAQNENAAARRCGA